MNYIIYKYKFKDLSIFLRLITIIYFLVSKYYIILSHIIHS